MTQYTGYMSCPIELPLRNTIDLQYYYKFMSCLGET